MARCCLTPRLSRRSEAKGGLKPLVRPLDYNGFEHLYRTLFSGKDDLYFMLGAYFDESNINETQRVAVVAGYLGSVEQWNRFCLQWKKLLVKYDVTQAHRSKLQHLKGEYSSWTETKRDKFLAEAYQIIRRSTYIPIGNAVVRKDFENILPKPLQKELGGVYGWCSNLCLQGVREWCDKHDYRDTIQYVFEAGAVGKGKVDWLFQQSYKNPRKRKEYRMAGLSFQDKRTLPLQAADIFAYDLGRYSLDFYLERRRDDVITYLSALIGNRVRDAETRFWDRKNLQLFMDKYEKV